MIRLLIVGDGPRDERVLPNILRSLLGRKVDAAFRPWSRLHQQRGGCGLTGYGRKLLYARRQARDSQ